MGLHFFYVSWKSVQLGPSADHNTIVTNVWGAGGDPEHSFVVGREDGSLVVARRLRWERAPAYLLTVAVTDGRHTAHQAVRTARPAPHAPHTPHSPAAAPQVNVTVVNDATEGGVWFSRAVYSAEVAEGAAPGARLLRVEAGPRGGAGGVAEGGAARLLYGLRDARRPSDLELFRLHELTGELELAKPLDRQSDAVHELTVWARDQAPRASVSLARVAVRVRGAPAAPAWGRRQWEARVPRGAAPGRLVAPLRAAGALSYSLAGDAAGLFAVDARGDVRLARALPAAGPPDYTLSVRAARGARAAAVPLHVVVLEPDDAPPRFAAASFEWEVREDAARGTLLGAAEARGGAGVRHALAGGGGAFRLAPGGELLLRAPLDYEECARYDLTVTAYNMLAAHGVVRVTVDVDNENDCAPSFSQEAYEATVLLPTARGVAVLQLEAGDRDEPERPELLAYDVLEGDPRGAFWLGPRGLLLVADERALGAAPEHRLRVRVSDGAWAATARVLVRVREPEPAGLAFRHADYFGALLENSTKPVTIAVLDVLGAALNDHIDFQILNPTPGFRVRTLNRLTLHT
ncbi:unnamed protein product [Leptidea sinapis]|uniref:Cadherin domain-containing protein n=1 Tax=Leptidea sinapis TaxID=189913 RepID=A0A5E4R5R4_9NEOP|nr:unnamed protein product [Leptidea sinapis]